MTLIDFLVKGQGHIDLVGKTVSGDNYRTLRDRSFNLGLVIVFEYQMTPVDFGVKGVKGQGHIDLVVRNRFRSIIKERLGLKNSKLV
jgi:hypothetical protein